MANVLESQDKIASPIQTQPHTASAAPSLWEDLTATPWQPVRTLTAILMQLVLIGPILWGMAIRPAIEAARKEKAAAVKPADTPPAENRIATTGGK